VTEVHDITTAAASAPAGIAVPRVVSTMVSEQHNIDLRMRLFTCLPIDQTAEMAGVKKNGPLDVIRRPAEGGRATAAAILSDYDG
jgi:hypothetical protein